MNEIFLDKQTIVNSLAADSDFLDEIFDNMELDLLKGIARTDEHEKNAREGLYKEVKFLKQFRSKLQARLNDVVIQEEDA